MWVPSRRARTSRTYAEPMNPAPPVTRRCRYSRSRSAMRPLDRGRQPSGLVVVASELGRAQQARDRAGVRPMTLVDAREEAAALDVVVQHVRDLEFATGRRGETFDDVERVRPQEVHA